MKSINTHQHNQQFAQAVMLAEDGYARYLPEFNDKKIALIGYGVTGKSAAEFLLSIGARVDIYDKQLSLSSVVDFANRFNSQVSFYQFNESIDFKQYDYLVVSPGVNLQQANIWQFKQSRPTKVLGDIELFCLAFNGINKGKIEQGETPTKLIVVTGSNGKSTVVDMLYKAIIETGVHAGLGGNFGTPALCLLKESYEVIVLELSSFQLESTYSLQADIACVLNVSEDHLDRHISLSNYSSIKRSIYNNAVYSIINQDDQLTYPTSDQISHTSVIKVSAKASEQNQCRDGDRSGLIAFDGETIYYKNTAFLSKQDILKHNQYANAGNFQMFNMQIVLACAHLLNLDVNVVQKSLVAYAGLRHRFEIIQRYNLPFSELQQAQSLVSNKVRSITWINDSKATNIGACSAAIENLSLHESKKPSLAIILIAGGDAKGASLDSEDGKKLSVQIKQHILAMALIGKDAELFTSMGTNHCILDSMETAVDWCYETILSTQFEDQTDVIVLLSPGCASIDMFNNYQHRGDVFVEQAKKVGRLCSN